MAGYDYIHFHYILPYNSFCDAYLVVGVYMTLESYIDGVLVPQQV